jgi:hypothetical protein
VETARAVAGQNEFAPEEIHLDLSALSSAVIDDTVLADRSGFGGSRRIDVVRDVFDGAVAERSMSEFMTDEERLVELASSVLVPDSLAKRIELRATTGEDGAAGFDRLDV